MKRCAPLLVLLAGCLSLEAPADRHGSWEGDCPGCALENELSGEVMLLVNGKLSDPERSWARNTQDERGHVIGSALFLYDPARRGELVKLGNLDLGRDPSGQDGQAELQVRNVAFSPEHGLWALGIEPVNDEWRLLRIGADLRSSRALLPQVSYALRTSDAAYFEEELVGLGFVGGELFLGGRGLPTDRPESGGALYRCAIPTGHAEDPRYPGDPDFYADRELTSLWARLPASLGLAGDVEEGPDGALLALVRSERRAAAPLDVNLLFTSPLEPPGLGPLAVELRVARNDDFTGLASIGGQVYAVDVHARVHRIDLATGAAELHDDLSGLFAERAGLRIRGATRVVLP